MHTKKNGFNIMLFGFIIILFTNLSCYRAGKGGFSDSLIETDRNFSNKSVEEGMFKSFLYYIADEGVILRDNTYPSKGKKALVEYFEAKSDTGFILSWEPLFERISGNGDLGYTYGIYANLDKETGKVLKGTYITIWEKQKDGSWKFVLDTGTEGLPEDLE